MLDPEQVQQQRADMALIEQQFSSIAINISELWGTRDCLKYLDELAIGHHGGRQEFPKKVFLALARIRQFHAGKHPGVSYTDIWALNDSE
jgi:hypothetical protein